MPFLLGRTGESEGSARKESKSRDVRRSAPFGGSGIMATKKRMKIKKTGVLIASLRVPCSFCLPLLRTARFQIR